MENKAFVEDFFGILTLFAFSLVLIIIALLLVNWLLWMFGKGRFKEIVAPTSRIRYLMADLFVKIIDDFRHLLALIVVSIFAFALLYGFIIAGTEIENIKSVLQAIVSTLGGLVGLIIGYYFGESAGKREAEEVRSAEKGVEEVEQAETERSIEMEEAIELAPSIPEQDDEVDQTS